jgi:AraC-like DNA-binding protein
VREEVGLSPKRLARLVRFSRAIDQIREEPAVDWAAIADTCGYYDQAHFNRDFKLFAGATPSDFLASRDPSSQAMLVG